MRKLLKKGSALILSIGMMLAAMPIPCSLTSYAATDSVSFNMGVADMPMTITYAGNNDSLTTDSSGKADAAALYSYLDSLGWINPEAEQVPVFDESGNPIYEENADGTPKLDGNGNPIQKTEDKRDAQGNIVYKTPDVTRVPVSIAVNCPDATTPENREAAGGLIEYKGKTEDITLVYDYTGAAGTADYKSAIVIAPPEKESVVEGTVKVIPYGKTRAEAVAKAGVEIALGSYSVTTDSEGKFKKYGITTDSITSFIIGLTSAFMDRICAKADFLNDGNTIYLKGRFNATGAEYSVQGAYDNKYIPKPSADKTYKITAADGYSLALSESEAGTDEIDVTVSPDGTMTPFHVIENSTGTYSAAVEDYLILDDAAPSVGTIAVESGKPKLNFKKHGMYGKTKAALYITVDVTDTASGVKELRLIGTDKNAKKTVYKAASSTEDQGVYKVTFAIDSEKKLLQQTLTLEAEDNVGNISAEKVLMKTKDESVLTLEAAAPYMSVIKMLDAKVNSYGWINKLPTFSFTTQDSDAGIEAISVEFLNGPQLYSKQYDTKETDKKTVKFSLTEEHLNATATSNGVYTIRAKVRDNSGNESVKKYSVRIDLTKPSVAINGGTNGAYYKSVPSISVAEDENYPAVNGNKVTIKVTRDGEVAYSKTFNKENSISIPTAVFGVDGNYVITASAVDAAGNKSNTATRHFIKDSTAPSVSLSGPNGGNFYNKAQRVTISVAERHYKTNSVHVSVTRTLNGKTVNVAFPWSDTGRTSTASKVFSETGTYRVSVYAVDKAGNRSATKTSAFSIDTIAPTVTISNITSKIYTYDDLVAPNVAWSDDYIATKSVTLTRAGENWYNNLAKGVSANSVRFSDFEKLKANDGLYLLTATVTDRAGNTTTKRVDFTVNRFGSAFIYDDAVKSLNGTAVQNVANDLVVREHNVSKLKKTKNEVRLDGAEVDANTKTENAGERNGYRITNHTFNADSFNKEGVYEINVLSDDLAGNHMESKDETGKIRFIVDRTEPTISTTGIEEDVIKASGVDVQLSVSDNLTKTETTVLVNGNAVTVSKDGIFKMKEGMDQTVSIVSVDAAGNEAALEKTVSITSSGAKAFFKMHGKRLAIGVIALAVCVGIVLVLRRKKEQEAR